MQTFQGLAVSDGLTVGPVVRIDRGAAGLHRIVCDPFRERALYEAAIVLAKDELNRLQQHACGQDADILMFQIALLEDESFTNEIGDYIAAGAGSAAAVERAEQIFAGRLKNVDDDYIRERSGGVCDGWGGGGGGLDGGAGGGRVPPQPPSAPDGAHHPGGRAVLPQRSVWSGTGHDPGACLGNGQ